MVKCAKNRQNEQNEQDEQNEMYVRSPTTNSEEIQARKQDKTERMDVE